MINIRTKDIPNDTEDTKSEGEAQTDLEVEKNQKEKATEEEKANEPSEAQPKTLEPDPMLTNEERLEWLYYLGSEPAIVKYALEHNIKISEDFKAQLTTRKISNLQKKLAESNDVSPPSEVINKREDKKRVLSKESKSDLY